MQTNASFLAMPEHPCMITRLIDEMREAFREFREDPRAYVNGALTADAGGGRRKNLLRVGLAIAILSYAIAFISMLVFWSLAHQKTRAAQTTENPHVVISIPLYYWPKADMPEGADKPGGGGGGGRKTVTPPSIGDLPISSLTQLVMAPRPEPSLTPPALPMIEKVMVDPRIQFKHDDLTPTGLPDGATFTPSAGPGSDGGMGTGSRGGMGVGDGPGVGQGSGGNTGGGERNLAVGRPNLAAHQPAVDERPILLNQPHPLFTEEARKNKVQGVVRVRILVDTNGAVKEVVVMRGLPDGLNEQAIRAAYQMRFRPAMKNGQPVVYWLNNVEVEFNLR
ncbi:MAG TPA: energy transducer TonB [Blastocatellia bacterium]|nr:energy transducer TonB [Blastocatellia bacterium]